MGLRQGNLFVLCLVAFTVRTGYCESINGAWRSDCQDLPDDSAGYYSLRPVDTFRSDGTATLRVHVFAEPHCTGKEWDDQVIPCTYALGAAVPSLPDTHELNLVCQLQGVSEKWYDLAERTPLTLRYGNQTGTSPEERPTQLGDVYYRLTVDQ